MLISKIIRKCARYWAVVGLAFGVPAYAAPHVAIAESSANAPAGCTGPVSTFWLKVIVEGVRSSNGLIAITLYADDSSRFLMKGGSIYVGRTSAVAGTTASCIYVPRPGVYVLAIYHDENGNQKFDRTGFGLPAEAYGFSNNPSTLLGLPAFRSVRLDVIRSGLTSHIRLKYP
ncbi:MAG: hypothetical protein RLY97_583 [Pseudomonadota bacterium]|jgi:uncharacterized protein (DUF2141 family)